MALLTEMPATTADLSRLEERLENKFQAEMAKMEVRLTRRGDGRYGSNRVRWTDSYPEVC